jgi:hypothetical protein
MQLEESDEDEDDNQANGKEDHGSPKGESSDAARVSLEPIHAL